MRDFYPPLKPGNYYHIYNRGNNKKRLFREIQNYNFFLDKWSEYLEEVLGVWAYCLLPNHFHFLVRIKDEDKLADLPNRGKSSSHCISNQFRNFFISYTKSFNKVYNRTGSLFQKPFKRIEVNNQNYLLMLIHYIHHNPIHHNYVKEYNSWKYSSYSAISNNQATKVKRKSVLQFFGGREAFLNYHDHMKNYNEINHLIIETPHNA